MQLEPRFLYDDDDDVMTAGEVREVALRPAPILERLLQSAGAWLRRCLFPHGGRKPPLMLTDRPHWPLPPANPAKRSREDTQPRSETEHLACAREVFATFENLPAPRSGKRGRDNRWDEWDSRCCGGRAMEAPVSESQRAFLKPNDWRAEEPSNRRTG